MAWLTTEVDTRGESAADCAPEGAMTLQQVQRLGAVENLTRWVEQSSAPSKFPARVYVGDRITKADVLGWVKTLLAVERQEIPSTDIDSRGESVTEVLV